MGVTHIIPLGGLGEVGKNMTAYESEGSIVIIDAGLAFPRDEHLGVDLVLPDFTYLRERESMIRGVVLTHGHEDHVGSLPSSRSSTSTACCATPSCASSRQATIRSISARSPSSS
jgi:mRNA degradation ribonuclease J1/J2